MGIPRLALAATALAAAAGAAAAARPGAVLRIENAARGRTAAFTLAIGEPFSVTYHHSMYDQPVTEEFVIDGAGRIVLEAVSSPSAAAREYFGILGPGERHRIVRPMREIVFRVAMGAPQRLRIGTTERSFLDFGEPGDRLVMRAVRPPPVRRLARPSRPEAEAHP